MYVQPHSGLCQRWAGYPPIASADSQVQSLQDWGRHYRNQCPGWSGYLAITSTDAKLNFSGHGNPLKSKKRSLHPQMK